MKVAKLLLLSVILLTGCDAVNGDGNPDDYTKIPSPEEIAAESETEPAAMPERVEHDGEVKASKSDIYVHHESDGVFGFARTDTSMAEVLIDGEDFNVTDMTVGDLYDIGYKNLYGEDTETFVPHTEHYGDNYILLIESDDIKESGVHPKICIYPYNPNDYEIPMRDCHVWALMLEGEWYDAETESARAFNTGVPTGFLDAPADADYYGVKLGMGLDALDYIPAESFDPSGQTFFQLTGAEADCTLQYQNDTVNGPVLVKIVIKNTEIYDPDLTYHRGEEEE